MTRIGLDTNVLLRLIVGDDAAQLRRARQLVASRPENDRHFVCLVVLVEAYWTLTFRYGYSKDAALEGIEAVTELVDLDVESPEVVRRALALGRERKAEFADALIAEQHAVLGCRTTVTFDRRAARAVPGMELVP